MTRRDRPASAAQDRHVALLRGVNVGGKNRLAMATLRALFEAAGGSDVETVIQSGNVVFGGDAVPDPRPRAPSSLRTRHVRSPCPAAGRSLIVPPMDRPRSRELILAAVAALALVACGEDTAATRPELPPLIGALEVPISFRNDAPAPSGALRIEASMTELRLEGQPVYANLRRGLIPEGERGADGLTLLLSAVRAAPARSQATLTLLGTVPYDTAVRVVQTLSTAGYHEIAFAVRRPGAGPSGMAWLALSSPQIAPATGPYAFPGGARRWEDFTAHWRDMYDACRAGQYVDCDGSPNEPAPGGEFQLVLWSRGQGMQMRFNQLNAPAAAPSAPARVEMLEGVPSAPATDEPPPPPPDTSGVFSFRAEEATHTVTDEAGAQVASSAISATARPVCGAAPCSTIIEADAETPIMRVLSFIGAAFPNGSTAPIVAFRMPE